MNQGGDDEERLLALMARYKLRKPARRGQVLIQSFSPASLQTIHTLDPSLPLIQLVLGFGASPALENGLNAIATYAVGVGPSDGFVSTAFVDAAHARCLDVHPYTVNQPAAMATLIATGVNGMFTNFPDRLNVVLGENAYKPKRAARRAARARARCKPTAGPNA